ncbi:MAG: hypothetical protein R3B06_11080 [Kofleriaceae bacterium]
MKRCVLFVLVALAGSSTVAAQPRGPAPPGHPRLFLDAEVRAAWTAQARQTGSAVAGSIAACTAIAADRDRYGRDLYMGLDWARNLQHCLVAWAATGADAHARTALVYYQALLDDLVVPGDGKGGDQAANRDSGFAIRALGPYTAIAYDWLHDHPAMTEALRAKARRRWAAWTTWYLANGYRARSPSTNYHAGYLAAVTFIAIAQRGEADAAGDALWRLVTDELWGKDMAKALAPGGVLDGGDWGEGWQYGPLAVVEYAAAARAMAAQGVRVDGVRAWADAVLARWVHGRAPGGGIYPGGDTQWEEPNLPPNPNTLYAVLIAGASPDHQAWAAGELAGVTAKIEFPLWAALAAAAGVKPTPVPRASWPTSYLAGGTGAYFARTGWGADATWVVSQCNHTIDVDHSHNNAGNFVLSRGADDVIVDPTPYGSLSTLTGNAPTVESAQLPAEYKPSQAWWSERTGFAWARQTASGVIATRCDYADQYKFQDRPSDVPAAVRDLVVIPWGTGATAVVIDRAASGDPARALHLQFRTPAALTAKGAQAVGVVGKTALRLTTLATTGGTAAASHDGAGSCFTDAWTRGNCAAARFPVDQWRLQVPGPTMAAIHVIDAVDRQAGLPSTTSTRTGDVTVVAAPAAGFAVVVGGGAALGYRGPAAARHVVLDGPTDATVGVSAVADGDGCKVTVAAGTAGVAISGRPRVFAVGADCAIAVDAAAPQAATAGPLVDGGAVVPPDAAWPDGHAPADGPVAAPASPRSARSGCCGAEAAPGAPVAMAVVVGLAWLALGRRRRRA